VGKTALARAYVRHYAAAYPGGIWWLRVKGVDFIAELLAAAAGFGWEVPDFAIADPQRKQSQQIAWIWQQWQQTVPDRRLVVLDDVDDYRTVQPYLPTHPDFQILLTSRQRFGSPVNRLDLDVMKRAEAFRTFRRYVDDDNRIREDVPTAKQILHWLGYLPLGIELVGKYLERRPRVSLAKLWERLQAKRLAAKAVDELPEERVYEYNLRAALDVSWQELSDPAKAVAGLLTVFALAPIPAALIEAALADWDEEELEDALDGELVGGSMVQFLGEGRYQLHQLVRQYLTAQLDTELADQRETLQRGMAIAVTEQAKTVNYTVTLNDLARMQDAVPHLEQVATHLTHQLPDDNAITPFTRLARLAQGQSRWDEAERWYKASLTLAETRFGTDHPQVATSLNNLAGLYYAQGRYGEAEPLYRRSLQIMEQQLGADHPDVATSLNNLASLYRAQGRYGEAEPLYLRSLHIREQQLGADHPHVAQSLNNLAGLYEAQGRYGEAEPLLQRSLQIMEQQLGADHPAVATSLNNLAGLYEAQGRYGEAEPLLQRSLQIREQQLGADHPAVATSLNNLAELYRAQGRYGEAEPLRLRCLEIERKSLGEDHPQIAASLNNLAELYRVQGRYGEAEPLYRRSLQIREQQLGADHPAVATSLNNLALLYYAQGRYGEAEPLLQRSLHIREQQLGADHPDVAASLNNLAGLYRAQGRYGEAEPLYRRALQIVEQQLGADHPDVATSLNNLALLYKAQGRYGEAEPLFLRSIEILVKALPAGHPNIATVQNNFAGLVRAAVAAGQAEQLSDHPTTRAMLQQLRTE
jgi:tetratricopeptide (TPR) repeat protein